MLFAGCCPSSVTSRFNEKSLPLTLTHTRAPSTLPEMPLRDTQHTRTRRRRRRRRCLGRHCLVPAHRGSGIAIPQHPKHPSTQASWQPKTHPSNALAPTRASACPAQPQRTTPAPRLIPRMHLVHVPPVCCLFARPARPLTGQRRAATDISITSPAHPLRRWRRASYWLRR